MVSERSPVSTVEGYRLSDPDRGWFRLPSLPGPPRGWIAAAHARGCFFAFGGGFFKEVEGQRETLRTPEAYAFDPARGEWARLADLPGPLSGAAAVTYQDRYVLILGGYAGGKRDVFDARLGRQVGEYNDVVWAYDVETNTYTALDERLPHGVNDLRAALVNDTLYAVGGENVDPPTSNTTDHLQVGRMMAVTK
jgi:N-acetylneuraminic acid mutarotase